MDGPKLAYIGLVATVLLMPSVAEATCWEQTDSSGIPEQRCCQAQGRPATCHPVPHAEREEIRRRRAARSKQQRDEARRRREQERRRLLRVREDKRRQRVHRPWHGRRINSRRRPSPPPYTPPPRLGWRPGSSIELGLGFSGRVTTGSAESVGRQTAGVAGIGLSAAYRYRGQYNAKDLAGRGLEAIPLIMVSFGLAALPRSAWLGNEIGIEIHGEIGYADSVFADKATSSYALRVVPALRVASPRFRLRFPSVLGVFIPSLGVQKIVHGPVQWTLSIWRIPIAVMLDEKSALEISLAAIATHVPDETIDWRVGGLIELRALVF